MKKHRLMLDYDHKSLEEVKEDITGLQKTHPELGDYTIEPSDEAYCWHVVFPKSELMLGRALVIAEESECDKKWLNYCRRYKCFAIKTVLSKRLQPKPKVVNPSVGEVKSSVKLIVTPNTDFNAYCCVRLCESINDAEWVWSHYTPLSDLKTRVVIGCRDKSQALRRLRWLSKRVDGEFEVKEE